MESARGTPRAQSTMNQTSTALLVIVGGLAGGLVGSALFSTAGEPLNDYSVEAPTLAVDSLAGPNPLSQRVNALEEGIAILEGQLTRLREEAGRGPRRDVPPPDFRSDNQPLAAAFHDPAFEETVLEVLEGREEAQRRERDERRAEQAKERMDRRMERYAEDLGLDAYQTQEMGRILSESEGKARAFFTELRESGNWDREEMRTTMTEMREGTMDQLSSILSVDQLGQYEESSSRSMWGGGRGGGGRNSRGGGGGQEF